VTPPARPRRWFQRHPRLAGLLIAFALIGLLDVALGTALHAVGIYLIPSNRHVRYEDPECHHALRPSISYPRAQWGPFTYSMYTNSLGMRDASVREVPLHAELGRRVLILGDSFTEGKGLEWEKTFPGMLQEELRGEGIGILNAGVSSYAPMFHLCRTRRLLDQVGLSFDAAVVMLDMSDIHDETQYDVVDGRIQSRGSMIDDRIKSFIDNHTIFLHALKLAWRELRRRVSRPDETGRTGRWRCLWASDEKAWSAYGEDGLARATQHMELLAELLASRSIRLTVVVYPWPDQIVRGQLDCLQRTHWKKWCERHSAGFVDLFPTFITGEDPNAILEETFFEGDYHWNLTGHRIVADALGDHIRDIFR
jgi:hypothetical protein